MLLILTALGSLTLGGLTLSKIINWITSQKYTYVYMISGASWYDVNLELWTSNDTLSEFEDTFSDVWVQHFEDDGNIPMHGEGHFVWFSVTGLNKPMTEFDWSKESWDGSNNKQLKNTMIQSLTRHWDKEWECGFGHHTMEGQYEVRWCKTNGS